MSQVITLDCELGEDKYLFLDASEVEGRVPLAEGEAISGDGLVWQPGRPRSSRNDAQRGHFVSFLARMHFFLELEDQIVHTRKWRNIDDVVGSMPNIPAFLAGTPNAMRRRVRVDRDDAPVSIFMDLTSSAGISRETVACAWHRNPGVHEIVGRAPRGRIVGGDCTRWGCGLRGLRAMRTAGVPLLRGRLIRNRLISRGRHICSRAPRWRAEWAMELRRRPVGTNGSGIGHSGTTQGIQGRSIRDS